MMLVLVIQWRSVRRLARDAADVQDPEWRQLFEECVERLGLRRPVSLRRSRERNMPMAIGIRRPAIVIPSVAETWPDDRRRAVLLHELAHVARRDCLSQSLAMAACAIISVTTSIAGTSSNSAACASSNSRTATS